jgi:TonB-linked SusC/RagA family outer membrane protein
MIRCMFGVWLSFFISLLQGNAQDSLRTPVLYAGDSSHAFREGGVSFQPHALDLSTFYHPAQLLQGRVAGLSIARPGGDVNTPFSIRLRGISSLTASAEPLVVVDGVPAVPLHTLDPNDIASIEVLKDVAGSAAYGMRGGSGVLQITTKSGQEGKPQTHWHGAGGVEVIARSIPVLSAQAYRQLPGAVDFGADTDWLGLISREGYTNMQHLALGGGNAQTRYRVALTLRDANGIALRSAFQTLGGRLNLTQHSFRNRVVFSLHLGTSTRNTSIADPNAFRYAFIANPTMPAYDTSPQSSAYGGYAQREIFDFYNPLALLKQNRREGRESSLFLSLKGNIRLSGRLSGAVQYSRQHHSYFQGAYSQKASKYGGGSERNGLVSLSDREGGSDFLDAHLRWEGDLKKGAYTVRSGYTDQAFGQSGSTASGGDFLTDAFSYHNLAAALDFSQGKGSVSSFRESHRVAAFYMYADLRFQRLSLRANARYEGSSRLGAADKWGLFPSLSTRYSLSRALSLRASWGLAGNQPGSSYASLQRYGPQGSFFTNGEYVPTYRAISNPNPNLTYEKTREGNIGLDFSLFRQRLSGSVDYYRRRSSDLILQIYDPLPPKLADFTWVNTATLQNKGIELTLAAQVLSHARISWQLGAVFATVQTELIEVGISAVQPFQLDLGGPGQCCADPMRFHVGEPFGQLRGPVLSRVLENGQVVFEDLNGDGKYCDCEEDKQSIGSGLPRFNVGLENRLAIGPFDLHLFLRGVFGHDLLNTYRLFYENSEPYVVANYNVVATKYYRPETRQSPLSDVHVEPADFVKLEYAALGYKAKLPEGGPFEHLRVYFSGQNLFWITGYTGIDPEVRYPGTEAGQRLYPGLERRALHPPTRSFSLGIQAVF